LEDLKTLVMLKGSMDGQKVQMEDEMRPVVFD